MNVTPKIQPADSQISAVLAKELADVEVSVETRSIGQQLLSSCFRFLRRLLVVAIGVYLLMFACLALFENRILYQGAEYSADIWKPDQQGFTEVEFETADGIKLFGWYLPFKGGGGSEDAPGSIRPRTILHCHGNGENIAQASLTSKQFSRVLQANVFSFDYRGFGKSEGLPNEAGLKQDADAALTWVCKRDNVKPTDVIIVGHSLGGGLACHLAEKHGCKALILRRTFSSLPDAAARKYWMFPVRLAMQSKMDSVEAIKHCDVPLFQSHGDADTLISIELGKKLFDSSPATDKQFFEASGVTHLHPLPGRYWTELEAFFERVDPRPPETAVTPVSRSR